MQDLTRRRTLSQQRDSLNKTLLEARLSAENDRRECERLASEIVCTSWPPSRGAACPIAGERCATVATRR
jgi:hypothetical protein